MEVSFLRVILSLVVGIILIIYLTTRLKVHAFFALIFSCFFIGLGFNLSFDEILKIGKQGFGSIIGSLSLIIVFGTTLGILMERSKATLVLANRILKLIGRKRTPLGMNVIGYVVGLPIFCDSGYIVLSSLNNKIAMQTGKAMALIAVSLASGLYAVHNLVPPHPGPAAATVSLSADFGKVFLIGALIAIPTALAGFFWARYAVAKLIKNGDESRSNEIENVTSDDDNIGVVPSFWLSAVPIVIPIFLIGLRSFMPHGDVEQSLGIRIIDILGSPDIALGVGCILAFFGKKKWVKGELSEALSQSVEKSGNILLIIGAGGALGAIIASVDIAKYLVDNATISGLGILFPFIVAATIKTAQGSSTVAIITTAMIVEPMLPNLGLNNEMSRVLTVLAIGAGGMTVSHANDSYFWVISKFSDIKMKTMLRVYTMSTLMMGLAAMVSIMIVFWIFCLS